MDFVTVRELRTEAAKVWEKVAAGEEIVLTRNGKPFAIIAPTLPSEVENTIRALRAANFGRLLAEQHRRAAARGLDKLPMKTIDAEIAQVRKAVRPRHAGGR